MRTPLLMVFNLLAQCLIATACGGEEATPVPSGVSADEVQCVMAEALAARSAAPNAAPVTELPFVIGVMDYLTGSARTYGNVAIQSKLLAAAEINAAGGINGRPLKLIIEDEKCNARDSITTCTKLTEVNGEKIILGTSCSSAMLGAVQLCQRDGVIMFSSGATIPQIAEAGDFIFRTAINDILVVVDTGNTIWPDEIRRLATITEETPYAEGVRQETSNLFKALGGKTVSEER